MVTMRIVQKEALLEHGYNKQTEGESTTMPDCYFSVLREVKKNNF